MAADIEGLAAMIRVALTAAVGVDDDNAQISQDIAEAIDVYRQSLSVPSGIAVQVNTGTGTGATTADGEVE